MGRRSTHPPTRCDRSEPESSHVTLPKAIDPRVQLRFPREGPVGRGADRNSGPSSGPMPPERSMIDVASQLVLLSAACVEDGSSFTLVGDAPVAASGRAGTAATPSGPRPAAGIR
jgi:hypothetical protein